MDAHEILAAGSPQAIPQGNATFARDEVSGWIVKHLTEAPRGFVPRLSPDQTQPDRLSGARAGTAATPPRIDSLERGATNSRPVWQFVPRESGSSYRGTQHVLAAPHAARREGPRPQGGRPPSLRPGLEIRIIAWRLMSKTHAIWPTHPPVTKAEPMGNSSGPRSGPSVSAEGFTIRAKCQGSTARPNSGPREGRGNAQ